MNRISILFFCLAAGCLLSACNGSKATVSAERSLEGTVTYRERVMLPADAEVVVQLIDASIADISATVIATDTFLASTPPMKYSLKYDPSLIEEGRRYQVMARISHDGKLRMINDIATPARFDGTPVEVVVRTSEMSLSSYIPTDFKAQGNEPFWHLTVDFERGLQLHRMGSDEPVMTPFPGRTIDRESRDLTLSAITEAHHLVIRISEENCLDTMADESYPYSVSVQLDDSITLNGCGHLMDDTQRLKTNWVLTDIQGAELDSAFKVPSLSIDLLQGTYSATDGCNGIGGEISFDPGTSVFKPGISTQMYCGNNFDVKFKKHFLSVDRYELIGEELLLYKGDEPVLTYKPEPLGMDRVERDLHDIWVVYAIGTTPIPKGVEHPRIEFYPAEGRISGYTSCNHFNGSLESAVGELRIVEPLAMTKRMCPRSVEKSFLTSISRISAYRRDGQRLYLIDQNGQPIMSLQKTD